MSDQEKKVIPAEDLKKADKSSVSEKSKESKTTKSAKPSFAKKAKKWFTELRGETKKVVWPSRELVIKNTTIVASVVLIVGIFIWLLDFALSFGVGFLISL